MKAVLLFAAAFGLVAADPVSPVGDWSGAIDTGANKLRLVLHIQKLGTGDLKASLDSLDQGAKGIQSSSVSFEGNTLKVGFEPIRGAYDAQISDDGKTLTGTWSQGGGMVSLTMMRGATAEGAGPVSDASATPLLGAWEGALDTGTQRLRLRFTLRSAEKGGITGMFDSLDQNAMDIPLSGITLKGSNFQFEAPGIRGSYSGTVNAARDSIEGTWKQGADLPLLWKKTK